MPLRKRYSQYFPALFLLMDLLCLNAGIFAANQYRFGFFIPNKEYQLLQLLLNILWMIVFFGSKLQEINRNAKLSDHLNKVLTGLVINLSMVFALWFVLQPMDYSRKHLFVAYLVFTVSILFWRGTWHCLIGYYRTKGYNIRRAVIVGKGDLSESLTRYFQEAPAMGYRLVGVVDNQKGADAKLEDFEHFASINSIDVVFCCLPNVEDKQIKSIVDFAENHLIKVNLISKFSKLSSYSLAIERFGNIPIIRVNAIPLDNWLNKIVKRGFDLIFSSIFILLILSWLIPVIGFLIKLESKGPVFFKQDRHCRDNNLFKIYKFRSMYVHQDDKAVQARRGDSRVTKIGAVLRKTSIDELPQFMNVLKGEMSVVGPRPHAVQHNIEFQPKIDRFSQRHAVKPGITGLAQAKGFRGETATLHDMSGRVKLDRFYIRNWSLILDIKIIVLTVISFLKGSENAY